GHVHSGNPRGHEPENLKRVFKESLARLKTDKVKIFYLVTPDSATPIESTLSAVQELHDEGLFEEFGVSNLSAWQVAEASEIAARHRWKCQPCTKECATRSRVRSNRNYSNASATTASVSMLTIRLPVAPSARVL